MAFDYEAHADKVVAAAKRAIAAKKKLDDAREEARAATDEHDNPVREMREAISNNLIDRSGGLVPAGYEL